MLVFVIRRVLISIPVLIASTILTFVLVKISGDPLQYLKLRNPRPPQSQIDGEAHRLYLDRSWPEQYWHWISNLVFHGNFGEQVRGTENIRTLVFSALWVTLRLVIVAVIIALILAVITGVLSAVKQYSILDYSVTTIGFLFLSMPTVFFAALLKQGGINVNRSTGSTFFQTIGERSIPITDDSVWGSFKDIVSHAILPVVVLGLVSYAAWSRFTRASMLEVLNSDYVRLARSKGLSPRRVLVRHALRTALVPLTTVTALDIAALLGGAIVTERVFQWNGMGNLFLRALQGTDFNVMLAWLLVSAVIVILFNLIADLLYGVLDPRIRNA
ncbi:peptide/nickel transport system permease protein [Jatrophihabitans endophyticus]|uniref:Peptide/nickel transport system permease protein n=1 Tax=Jatrophihabitans endophyticus TaxID=1206085 RepID=A0A1M5T8W2_9ACTN|nr:ABC transporter permease [Jatrophihabitans endophyticus]SHH47169.1 peptide/nickel transport system permease protein [Jatrophihabitans endophyticus]